jgi:hypothetical protein
MPMPRHAGLKTLLSKTPNAITRYRLTVSDGLYSNAAMLSTQLGELAASGSLVENGLIRVHEMLINEASGKK